MFVKTTNPIEQKELQQKYVSKENSFIVPYHHTQQLLKVLRSIKYEHFKNNSSDTAQKLQQFLSQAVNLKINLDEYHQLLSQLKKEHKAIEKYRQYITKLNTIIEDYPQSQINLNSDKSSSLSQSTLTQNPVKLSYPSFALEYFNIPSVNMSKFKESDSKTININTAQSHQSSQAASEQTNSKQAFSSLNSPKRSPVFSRDQWKIDRSDSNQTLSDFNKTGSGIFQANPNFKGLIVKELMHDLTRQMFVIKDTQKREQKMTIKYNKSIKQALMFSKLKVKAHKK